MQKACNCNLRLFKFDIVWIFRQKNNVHFNISCVSPNIYSSKQSKWAVVLICWEAIFKPKDYTTAGYWSKLKATQRHAGRPCEMERTLKAFLGVVQLSSWYERLYKGKSIAIVWRDVSRCTWGAVLLATTMALVEEVHQKCSSSINTVHMWDSITYL